MGSLFSSPAGRDSLPVSKKYIGRSIRSKEEDVALRISTLVDIAIEHYNSNNPGAEFEYPEYPPQSTTEMKAACIGFRGTFWYHLCFSAHPMDATTETQHFFAELYFDRQYLELAVETCIILEKPLCRFSSSCAFCPDESNILHPSDEKFVCGKQDHKKEFFRRRDMLVRPYNSFMTPPDIDNTVIDIDSAEDP
ncbi:hypothetical protein CFC21_026483 [Triticum aestivum]|uniref:DUF3615 domain-containing protein n=2 Tax=Triticum aestivum TaxID=4565 RepID=A0A3B6CGC0_WHEAT|nr:uncharacterized protein LOC123042720 [Triticum aestivum]KAF7012273.1 hypothetical protein CFC21_026483 [Triticum aestivum]